MIDVLVEYKSSPLYHGTDFKSAYLILKSNELRANVSNSTETYGVSFTRNKNEAYSECYIQVDQEKLSYNYRIHPVYRDGIAGRDLAEERVDKTITNIKRYIDEIEINHRLIVKRVRIELASIFMTGRNILNESDIESYYLMKLIEECENSNIKTGPLMKEASKYIDMFLNGDPDEYYITKLTNRRNRND